MSGYGSNLWNVTAGYGATSPRVGYLDDAQNCRRERLRVARMLRKGDHRCAYLEEGRTQFDFPEMRVQDRVIKPYIKFNVLKLISSTFADLLLGQDPSLRVADATMQEALDLLKTRSDLHRVFYDAARTANWAAEAMVEVTRWDGEVYIQDVKPDEIFPIGDRQPDGQYGSYRRYATATIDNGKITLLLETTYLPGLIQRACYKLVEGTKREDSDLALWPVKNAGRDLLPQESTGIAWNTIIWVGNEIEDGEATSDYDGLIELQDELNAKQTQIARVISKHSDPKLAMPESKANPNGNVRSDHDLFYFRTKEEIPQYITWTAELAAAIEDRDFTLNGFCLAAEMSQGLLGLDRGAAPDSAKKLRLQATKAIARTTRKATFMRPFIRTAVETALMMENAGRRVTVAMGGAGGDGASVELRDGLPVDELDQATTLSTLRTAGLLSVERGVRAQLPDEAAAAEEIATLQAEAAANTPSINIGGPVGESAMATPAGNGTPAEGGTPAPVTAGAGGNE